MLLADARGAPLSSSVTGANRHDVTQLATTLDSIVVERPDVRDDDLGDILAFCGRGEQDCAVRRTREFPIKQAHRRAFPEHSRMRECVAPPSPAWYFLPPLKNRSNRVRKLDNLFAALYAVSASRKNEVIAWRSKK